MKQIHKLLILFTFLSSAVYGQSSLLWDFSTGGGVYSSPAVDNSTLYIGSNDSCLYALDKENGSLKWKFKTRGEIKSQPLLYKGSVIFNSTDGLVYSIDKSNAKEQWTFNTNGEKRLDMWDYYLSSPVYSDNKVFIGSGDGNIYAIEPSSGTLIWKFTTDGIVHATPLIHNKIVYAGSFDGFFYAINTENGELVWKFRTVGDAYFPKGEIQEGAAIYKNSVIFGSRDFNIYSLDIETGRGLWNMKEKGSWVIATPLIVDDVVYFGTSDSHRFVGLSANTGYEKCSYPLNMRVYGKAVFFENDIYFGCFNGKLYKLVNSKGKLEQVFQTHGSKRNYHLVYNENDDFRTDFELYGKDIKGSEKTILELGAILSTPIVDKGIIYFGDANGLIYAYKLK
jgi:outer membrane protein assembly factor BamB